MTAPLSGIFYFQLQTQKEKTTVHSHWKQVHQVSLFETSDYDVSCDVFNLQDGKNVDSTLMTA